MILAAVDIINILRKSRLHVDGIGEIDIYAKSIIAGSNSVASRCQIDGIGGDFLFKCYYVADGKRLSQRDTLIEVYTIMGLTYRARCTIHRWMEGVILPNAESLEIAKQKLLEVGDMAHYNIADALSKGCIDSALIVQSLTAENRIAEVKRKV